MKSTVLFLTISPKYGIVRERTKPTDDLPIVEWRPWPTYMPYEVLTDLKLYSRYFVKTYGVPEKSKYVLVYKLIN